MTTRKAIILLIINLLITNIPISAQKRKNQDIAGIYMVKHSTEKLELRADGTYILWYPKQQCDYASKGKWSFISDNVIEITSENYYLKQKGYEYHIKKEHKFSEDSIYIRVVFPASFAPPVKLSINFNYYVTISTSVGATYVVLPKSKYLWRNGINTINFDLTADTAGATLYLYRGRIAFKIFEQYEIDTGNYNYLTIFLPYFDRCFFEFKLYHKELMYIINKNSIMWERDIRRNNNYYDNNNY